ncbi:MAG TPA: efflux RND transporter periplasmic adaptor subunit [Gemmatimonadales bacterium]|nr:efflux RND transporter periplasmic adaptor subunit [Gemmatimonadales bacterium]
MIPRRLTIAMLAILAAACNNSNASPPAPPPPEVGVVPVEPRTLPLGYEFVGEVQPIKRVEVRARVDGVIEERPFTEGALVKRGQVLYRLERVRYEAAYRSAAARLNNARRLVERLEPLLARRAVAQQDVDNARTELEAAQGAYDEARKDRDDAVVRAEIDGRITRTQLEVGARVTGPSDLLTTIEQVAPVYVTFRPSAQDQQGWRQDERSRRLVQPGSDLEVKVVLPDGTELPRGGQLDYVSPSVDPATGTLELRASFDNGDGALVAGQFVRVRLHGFQRDSALAVPRRAVQQSLDKQFVLVVGKGDTVAARDVDTGTWSGDWWIIESGLQAGERVVVDGVQKATPGRPVRPVTLADTAEAAQGGAQ